MRTNKHEGVVDNYEAVLITLYGEARRHEALATITEESVMQSDHLQIAGHLRAAISAIQYYFGEVV